MFNRFAVVKLLFSFGYDVRPAVRQMNGELLMSLPYTRANVVRVYRKEQNAIKAAAVLNEEAQFDREAKVFNLSERWHDEQ